ncbi:MULTISPECIES: helix-turn-helix domain-containing protein [unclassified Streptomyces]|uniref:helix-turn-helix domain-containing protein n=1 Tax=unclassified Streptomyces TaxID=2593676 RepID=UPI000B848520|nr:MULTISPECIES: helix-turn-helix domain-containing protein [unclassified Streptomyces]MYS22834.1 helix-turn-helix domain-containing protein [Streptomyces sp. SID4948]
MSVRLRDSLSNPSKPLVRLFKALEDASGAVLSQVEPVPVDPAAATEVRECRMLSADEVAEIAEEYRRGAGVNELARRYGAHRQTVDRHLERAKVLRSGQ